MRPWDGVRLLHLQRQDVRRPTVEEVRFRYRAKYQGLCAECDLPIDGHLVIAAALVDVPQPACTLCYPSTSDG